MSQIFLSVVLATSCKFWWAQTVKVKVAQTVKRLPAMQEAWVQSLVQEDPLEKEMATHSSVLAWRIPWTDHGVAKSQTQLSD